jgi:hypothetical protein
MPWIRMGRMPPHCTTIFPPCALLDTLLESLSDIFDEPQGLSLVHCHDHRIQLFPGMTLVAI